MRETTATVALAYAEPKARVDSGTTATWHTSTQTSAGIRSAAPTSWTRCQTTGGGKILRRVTQAAHLGATPGDLNSTDDGIGAGTLAPFG